MQAIDKEHLRIAAEGRWIQIHQSVCGLTESQLNPKRPGPCPVCRAGTNRYRAHDDVVKTGALFCNQCFNKGSGDGFAAVRWLRGCTFPEALQLVADAIGYRISDQPKNGKKTPMIQPSEQTEQLTPKQKQDYIQQRWSKTVKTEPVRTEQLTLWQGRKPGIRLETLLASTVRLYMHKSQICIAFPAADPEGKAIGFQLARIDGEPFPAFGNGDSRKYHTMRHSQAGWFCPNTRPAMLAAKRIFWCEGPGDALAVQGLLTSSEEVAITTLGGASAVPKKDLKWMEGKEIVVLADADQPGISGANKRAQAALNHTDNVRIVHAPFPIEESHGKDMRDWIASGAGYGELMSLVVKAELFTEAASNTEPAASPSVLISPTKSITNFVDALVNGERKRAPVSIDEIVQKILKQTNGWPKLCGKSLFVLGRNDLPRMLQTCSDLYGWLGSRLGEPVDFARESGYHTQQEVMAQLRESVEWFDSIDLTPHEPPVDGIYYATPDLPEPTGKHLDRFVSMFNVQTAEDAQLLKAMLATIVWGGEPGSRPLFLLTADGRGAGKTTLAEVVSEIAGGCLSVGMSEKEDKICERLLSSEGRKKRVCIIDNAKGFRISSEFLERIITCGVISGKELYQGEGTRPNLLTWIVTSNSPGLGRDIAQRVVSIKLRTAKYKAAWRQNTLTFLREHRLNIIADLVAIIRQPEVQLSEYTRWASWEGSILSKLQDPQTLHDLIVERQKELDAESEESDDLEESIARRMKQIGYPPRCSVWIPGSILTEWFNDTMNSKHTQTRVTRAVNQMIDEGLVNQLVRSHDSSGNERGFKWIPIGADGNGAYQDLRSRIASEKYANRNHQSNPSAPNNRTISEDVFGPPDT